jgi:hypothetical protein
VDYVALPLDVSYPKLIFHIRHAQHVRHHIVIPVRNYIRETFQCPYVPELTLSTMATHMERFSSSIVYIIRVQYRHVCLIVQKHGVLSKHAFSVVSMPYTFEPHKPCTVVSEEAVSLTATAAVFL